MYFTDSTDFFDVKQELLGVASNWRGVGEALRLEAGVLDIIESDGKDSKSCLAKVLTEWLNQNYNTSCFGRPSWKLLVAAVAHPAGGNNRALAKKIAQKYNGKEFVHIGIICLQIKALHSSIKDFCFLSLFITLTMYITNMTCPTATPPPPFPLSL